eukprot:3832816-Pyramimonas_sp.AAC.1
MTEEWPLPDSSCTGVKAVDTHKGILTDVEASARKQLWQKASEHYCGDGVQDGVDNESCRRLLLHL